MKKFVEFHRRDSNDAIIFNMDHITGIESANDGKGGTAIALIDYSSYVYVKEEYRKVKQMLIDYNAICCFRGCYDTY